MAERQSIKKVNKDKLLAGVYEATFNTSGKVVSWDFGKFIPGFTDLPEVPKQLIIYGAKQKIDDSMAGAADEEEAITEAQSTVDALEQGKWTMRVAGDGEAGGLMVRAFAEARGMPLADAKVQLSEALKKNMEANPKASERQVASAIRANLLANDTAFKAAYTKLQDERTAKAAKKITVTI